MAYEQHETIIGLSFTGTAAIQQAIETRVRLHEELGKLAGESLRLPGINKADLERIRTQLSEAFRRDFEASPAFRAMTHNPETGKAIRGGTMTSQAIMAATPQGSTPFAAEQMRLYLAEMNKREVDRRSRLALDSSRNAYKTEDERSKAQTQAALRVELANRQLERAIMRELKSVERADRAIQKVTDDERAAAQRYLDEVNKAHYRRIMAEDKLARALEQRAAQEAEKAAEQAALRAEADRQAAGVRPTYADPDVTTPVGKAQASVNHAEAALAASELSLATLRRRETYSAEAVIRGEDRVRAATEALLLARTKLASIEAASAASAGSLRQQFMTGFHGRNQDRGYVEQMGQAFKFSLFYGTAYKLLFALTATFQQTLQEGIEFQQAVTELKLSAGRTGESIDALADSLGRRSTEAGFAPSQGVLVGARSLGLYGVTQASAAEQARVADISARVVSRLAMGSDQQPADLQANIAAIAQAFGTGAEGQYRIADLDAYMSHLFGIAPGQSLQAVSEAATVGRAAGFNQEEVTAIAADMISRTGQSPSAVAGFMAQIFSRGGEGSLTSVAGRYGIDPTLDLATQIEQLAAVYKDASSQERAQISAAFGRGKVQNAAIALLQDYDAVKSGAEAARTDAGGAADAAFEERLRNLGGQLGLLMGSFKDFANQLGQTGVLEVLGAGVVALRLLAEAGTDVLRTFNEMSGPLRAAVVGLGLLALSSRGAAAANGASTLGALSGAGGLLSRAGSTLSRLATPTNLAIGGLMAMALMRQSTERLREAQDAAADALGTRSKTKFNWLTGQMESSTATPALTPGSTPDDYRARAAAITAAATDERDAAGSWTNYLGDPTMPGQARAHAETLDAEAARLLAVADALEAHASKFSDAGDALIHGFDADTLASDMDLITNAGGGTRQQLEALRASLLGTADAAGRVRMSFDPEVFANQNIGTVQQALYDHTSQVLDAKTGEDRTADLVNNQFSANAIRDSIKKNLASTGATSLTDLDGSEIATVAKGVIDDSGLSFDSDADYKAAVKDLRQSLREQVAAAKAIADGSRTLTGPEATNAVNLLVAKAQEAIDNRPESDFGGRVRRAARLVNDIQGIIGKTEGGATPQMLRQLGAAERNLAQVQFDSLEQMRKAAQQNARSRAEVARIGRSFMRREIASAIRGGNQDVLATIIGQAGAGAIRIAREIIQEAIAAARAANRVQLQIYALQRAAQGAISELDFVRGGQGKGVESAITNTQQSMLDMLDNAITSGGGEGNVYLTGSDVPGYESPDTAEEKAKKDRETALERAAARAAANAARSESPIAAARAEMMGARAAMAKAKKGTVEYYNALESFYSARNQLTDAILEYRNTKYLLGIDNTDPLAQAEAALRAARAKLRSDRGKAPEVRATDRLAVQEAEANREATAFQQRLDAVQTAEQLGRISHAKYLDYLNSESRRLNRIKDRTYQQQQQLDQIDTLLKEAAGAMDAQWNFGDINLPTPYQVRRQIEQQMGGGERGHQVQNVANTTIQIDGADIGAVTRIIERYVGKYGRTLATAHRHR